MQKPQLAATTGDMVRLRRQRWRVVDPGVADGDVRLVTLSGAGDVNAGAIGRFILPFDELHPIVARASVRRVTTGVWRRAVRGLIASSARPGSLRSAATARIDLLPHQLEPALAIVRGEAVRVLLADDVGLGKTIQAGLILSELRVRRAIARALILTPAGLRDQWQAELHDRFALDATIADAPTLRAASTAFASQPNPWLACDVAIASLDLAKRPEHLADILRCGWDLAIVDEAHNASIGTDRGVALDAIASRAAYVVLLTATPHSGSRAAFVSLCRTGVHDDAVVVFRRTRTDVHIRSSRHTHRLAVTPTPAERRMHDALAALTRAIAREHGEASAHVWLALSVLNKRALSSASALERSVRRRLASLAIGADSEVQWTLPFDDPDGELDDRDAAPAWTGGPALADAARERRLLGALAEAARSAAAAGESKLAAVRRWIRRTGEHAIVFTEYRDTLQQVAASLPFPAFQLHGGLSAAERRTALRAFGDAAPPAVLLATDAAGEGLNLHDRCRTVINLELPWNPVRLEQRIGRVDRIGQRRTVHAVLLMARRTPEERILARLRARIAHARADIAAADPLGAADERDIQRLVVAGMGAGSDASDASAVIRQREDDARCPSIARPSRVWDADAEVARASLVRKLRAPADACTPAGGTLVGRTRHRDTRRLLAGTALWLVEATLEDGCGRIVERMILPLVVAGGGGSVGVARSGELASILLATEPFRRWHVEAERTWRAFMTSRLTRERAIAAALAATMKSAPVQSGLFDRRPERAAAAAQAAAEDALETIARRLAISERSASRSDARVHLRVVLATGR